MTFKNNCEDILRLTAAFVIAQLLGTLLISLLSGLSGEYWYGLLLNVLFVLVLNIAVHFLFCGGIRLPKKSENYCSFEPCAFFFAAVFFSCFAVYLTRLITGGQQSNAETVYDLNYLLYAVYTVILAPISEELAFRGAALSLLSGRSKPVAAVVSALFFAVYHFDLEQLPYTFVLGYFLAILALRSGSVVPCIFVHIANNLLTLAVGWADYIALTVNIFVPLLGTTGMLWLVVTKRLWK